MTQYSYSRVSLFEDCPYHFKLRYIDRLTEIPKLDADNPLIIGSALHKGIETDVETALEEYYNAFPVLTDAIIHEAMKLEILIPKVKEFLEQFIGFEAIHEYDLDKPDYKGFVDLLLVSPNKESMLLDFKYSNNVKNYLDSGQLHIYKHYLEEDGYNIKKMGYLFVPKTNIKQKDNEDLFHYRRRLVQAVEESKVKFVPIEYDEMNVIYFRNSIKRIEQATEWPKNTSGNCFSCNPRFSPDYLEAIQNEKGEIIMALPKNERREITIDEKPDFWIYADSYVGKSTFVDKIDNLLFLNTDGNTDNTTAPFISIKNIVTKTGRVTNRKLAWEVFLDTITDLETEKNDFEAVALDLVEDIYEHCRFYVFDKNGWEHESDGSWGKGWSAVTTEFNNAMKRLKALGYQIIYISKEQVNEITLKGGAKRTTFRPNIGDKQANFLTGTVDLTLRAYVDSNDERHLQLAKKQNVFGGGRYDWQVDTIPLDMEVFLEELKAAQEDKETKKKDKAKRESRNTDNEDKKEDKPKRERKKREPNAEQEEKVESFGESADKETTEEDKPKRERRSRNTEEDTTEEKPKRQRRERKAVDETPPGEDSPADDEQVEEESKPRTRRRRTRVGGDN